MSLAVGATSAAAIVAILVSFVTIYNIVQEVHGLQADMASGFEDFKVAFLVIFQ